jgi:hypothetical protein
MRLSGLCAMTVGIDPLDSHAQQIQGNLSNACKAGGIGHHVHVEAVDSPEGLSRYVSRYLRGVAECGRRYYADKGARLWGASRRAHAATVSHRILIPREARGRMKMAAWIRSRGVTSFAEARRVLGPKYAYNARDAIQKTRLRSYKTEDDFFSDWGCRLTPEALGIDIWDPAYSAARRKHIYDFETIPTESKASVERALRCALPLRREEWLKDQIMSDAVLHSTNHSTNTSPKTPTRGRRNYKRKSSRTASGHRDRDRNGHAHETEGLAPPIAPFCPSGPLSPSDCRAPRFPKICE